MHKDTKYVLFLDDDVRLHPGSIGALTAEMEKRPEVWLYLFYLLLLFDCDKYRTWFLLVYFYLQHVFSLVLIIMFEL